MDADLCHTLFRDHHGLPISESHTSIFACVVKRHVEQQPVMRRGAARAHQLPL